MTKQLRSYLLNKITQLDTHLFRKGFKDKNLRQLFLYQLTFSIVLLCIAIVISPVSLFFFYISIGNIISCTNLYLLTRFTSSLLQQTQNRQIKSFFLLIFRLSLLAFLLFICIIYFNFPLLPFIAGLSSILGVIILWALIGSVFVKHK